MPPDDVRALIAKRQAPVRRSRPPIPARQRVVIVERSTAGFLASAGVLVVAGGAVAAVNSAAPFGHGSWLAAYLVLVGGISQIILSTGQVALGTPARTRAVSPAQLVLWNLGSLAVPAGVFADWALPVTVGSGALLAALALFAVGAGGMPRDARGRSVLYLAIVVGLAVSVVVGSALADAAPGVWL
jgi:hypothetical protein